ncbi:hypothetical protein E2C01_013244 [Portunus trituberculatus]|uniref:Uncharacterized protein n=1 Tax=Portunus trituberculatus TaxID=210409 RepID=A0A5B7DGR7_PORTR|nr:hypothetical protein [Portunus trituberculatus]
MLERGSCSNSSSEIMYFSGPRKPMASSTKSALDIFPNIDSGFECDAFLCQQVHSPLYHFLAQLHGGDAVLQQPSHAPNQLVQSQQQLPSCLSSLVGALALSSPAQKHGQ